MFKILKKDELKYSSSYERILLRNENVNIEVFVNRLGKNLKMFYNLILFVSNFLSWSESNVSIIPGLAGPYI